MSSNFNPKNKRVTSRRNVRGSDKQAAEATVVESTVAEQPEEQAPKASFADRPKAWLASARDYAMAFRFRTAAIAIIAVVAVVAITQYNADETEAELALQQAALADMQNRLDRLESDNQELITLVRGISDNNTEVANIVKRLDASNYEMIQHYNEQTTKLLNVLDGQTADTEQTALAVPPPVKTAAAADQDCFMWLWCE